MTQQDALDILKSGKNVFLTGAAGSGKTHLLHDYVSFLRKQQVGVGITASTGIAATHIGGMTIHAWAGIGITRELSDQDIVHIGELPRIAKRMRNTHVLVIDEISMLDARRLDMVDRVARYVRGSFEPFGGMQIVLCGDFFQLPPVSSTNEDRPEFAYRADTWEQADLRICYLHERHRHEDGHFYELLDTIRRAAVDEDIRATLLATGDTPQTKRPSAKLYSHNANVDTENERKLLKLAGDKHEFHMHTHGSKKIAESMKRSCLAPELLTLKKGAAVMFVKNNFEDGYVNGTLGTVAGFSDDGWPIVQTMSGKTIEALPVSWSIEENGKVLAEIKQVPLRLAWAITIHKSQGMTLDAAQIDLSRAFEPGMGYVALSRVRSYAGLCVTGLNEQALDVHPDILQRDSIFRRESEAAEAEYKNTPRDEWEKTHKTFLKKIGADETAKPKQKKGKTVLETKELVESGHSLAEIARIRHITEDTVITHIEELIKSGVSMDIAHLKKSIPADRFQKIASAFAQCGKTEEGVRPLTPVMQILGNDCTYTELRIVRMFLD